MTDRADREHPEIEIRARSNISQNLVAIGKRYWLLDGFEIDGRPRWAEPTSSIDTDFEGLPHVAAARGVQAVVGTRTCVDCSNELILTSRTAYERVCQGEEVDCVKCNTSMQNHLRRVIDPETAKRRRAQKEKEHRKRKEAELLKVWERAKYQALKDRFPFAMEADNVLPETTFRTESVALTLLHYSIQVGILGPIREWEDQISPAPNSDHEVIADVWRSEVIRPHPSSDPTAFEWDSFESDDKYRDPTPTGAVYPLGVCWYVPYGDTLESAHLSAIETLTARINYRIQSGDWKNEIAGLVGELFVEEALRYFRFQLELLNLPNVPSPHTERLRSSLKAAAKSLSLGQLYQLVWRSTRRAATAAQTHLRAPRESMTTHAVNQLEKQISEALVSIPSWLTHYSRDTRLPLALMTRELFEGIFNRDPMQTTIMDLKLPSSPDIPAVESSDQDSGKVTSLMCTVCDVAVPLKAAWLCVDVSEALNRSTSSDEIPALNSWEQRDPPLVRWQVVHVDCDLPAGAVHDVQIPTSKYEWLQFAAEILRKTRWVLQTDIAALLDEAANQSGRFEPIDESGLVQTRIEEEDAPF